MHYVITKLKLNLEHEEQCVEVAKKHLENIEGLNKEAVHNYEYSLKLSEQRVPELKEAIKILENAELCKKYLNEVLDEEEHF